MQTTLSYLGQFRTRTHTRSSNPSSGLSFCLSGKHMPLFVLPAPCWGFEKRSCSSPNLGEARGKEHLHGVDHDRLEMAIHSLGNEAPGRAAVS